jgi:hypothetical protein
MNTQDNDMSGSEDDDIVTTSNLTPRMQRWLGKLKAMRKKTKIVFVGGSAYSWDEQSGSLGGVRRGE